MEISSIHTAAEVGDESMVKSFCDMGISVDVRDDEKCTPLHHAAEWGNIGVASFLISKNCDLNAQRDDGATPLMLAAGQRHPDIVELLVKADSDLAVCDEDNWTALHHAANKACPRSVKAIAAMDPDIDAKNFLGETALMLAGWEGDQEDQDQQDVVEILLQSGADVGLFDCMGRTALHHASLYMCIAAVKAIVNRGADLDAKTGAGQTALMLATGMGRADVVEFLLQSGADPYLKDEQNRTAFYHAVDNASLELVTLFINYGYSFDDNEYRMMYNTPLLKENMLKDKELCTRAIINTANNVYFPAIYRIPYLVNILPSMKNLKIENFHNVSREIEKLVDYEIQTNRYCNVVEIRPLPLKFLVIQNLYNIFCD